MMNSVRIAFLLSIFSQTTVYIQGLIGTTLRTYENELFQCK